MRNKHLCFHAITAWTVAYLHSGFTRTSLIDKLAVPRFLIFHTPSSLELGRDQHTSAMSVSLLHKLPGILLLGILLVGCTEDPGAKPDDPSAPQLTLSVPELNYADDGGTRTVVIRSNTGWTVSGANDWCTTDKAEGSYDGEVTVTTQANTDYDDRSVNLTVKAGSVTKILTVNQRKKDALTLTQARYEIRQEGGAIAVEVKHNVDFTVEIPQEFAGWITPITTKGLSAASLQFEIAANPAYDAREGKIIIRNSNGTLADTLYVVQAQLDKLGITESQRTVAPEGGAVAVAVNTNLDYVLLSRRRQPGSRWLHRPKD